MVRRTVRELRSHGWFGSKEYYSFARRAWLRAEGFSHQVFEGKPVIGICNSWSELNNCNVHLRAVADAVKRGVWAAGGVPLEFPTISLGEVFIKPTSMLLRNLMALDVEESIRGNPMDGVVLLCGCDKTTPAQLMGASSVDIPAIVVTVGPMLAGLWRGRELGGGTDGRRLFDLYRSGRMTEEQLCEVEGGLVRTMGHCGVMGTASTMALMAEALGMTLPDCASIPAVDARRLALAEATGRRIVAMVAEDLKPSRVMTRAAFENAITVLMAAGGSSNAVVHLLAIAGRLGVPLALDDFDAISRRTPWLANIKPSGEFLMEDFSAAGGLPALLAALGPSIRTDVTTVNGGPLAVGDTYRTEVIHSPDRALSGEGGVFVLRGNLCPRGALLKQTAASPELLRHRGAAYVFENYQQMQAQIDSPDLPVNASTVLVLRNAGPKGGPGFPEWGNIPLPRVLLERGVSDMVRISDARMSGTAFGTVVLQVTPESAAGGPLAAVRTGDVIELDAPRRRLTLCVEAEEIEKRLATFEPPVPHYSRGYGKLFLDHIMQADTGCDFDFLRGAG